MGLLALANLPDDPAPRRGRGRTRHEDIPELNYERGKWAWLVLKRYLTVAQAARAAEVSRHTITLWINQQLDADGTNGDELRELAKRHPRRRAYLHVRTKPRHCA